MRESHSEVSVMSPRLATTVESCTAAALSTDARDKYFVSYVGEGSPWAGRQGEARGKGEISRGVSEYVFIFRIMCR